MVIYIFNFEKLHILIHTVISPILISFPKNGHPTSFLNDDLKCSWHCWLVRKHSGFNYGMEDIHRLEKTETPQRLLSLLFYADSWNFKQVYTAYQGPASSNLKTILTPPSSPFCPNNAGKYQAIWKEESLDMGSTWLERGLLGPSWYMLQNKAKMV